MFGLLVLQFGWSKEIQDKTNDMKLLSLSNKINIVYYFYINYE